MVKYLLCVLVWAMSISLVMGQSLRGKITDQDEAPLQDAYIYRSSDKHHTHSDQLGKFVMSEISIDDTIHISYIGFKSIDVIITPKTIGTEMVIKLEEQPFSIDQIVITGGDQSISKIADIDLNISAVQSSQEVLRRVPGLFIAQHAGGGKAEQIFLRGFDIDHGTDITISVDNLPVNMVSHAHGQGYSDLHFLIPEIINDIDFGKGPYYIDKGNFNTAGYVQFNTRDRIEQSLIGIDFGRFNTSRFYGLIDILGNVKNHDAYLATEYLLTDGPVLSPQNFHRLNMISKYTVNLPHDDKLSLMFTRFSSKWDASGQVPQRLVDNGTISRFGSVDDTEGGMTSRTNFSLELTKTLGDDNFIKNKVWMSDYNFELYSNFTFFLNDPINGDQIRQKENRNIYGIESVLYNSNYGKRTDILTRIGLGVRYDDIDDIELSHTANRSELIENISLGDIDETNVYSFAGLEFKHGPWVIQPGLRVDFFNFSFANALIVPFQRDSKRELFAGPKLNIFFNANRYWQIFFKSGRGFHSNDTRVIFRGEDEHILPAALGADLGVIWKPTPKMFVNLALWQLQLDQEFVYVGDEGIVEPSGETLRKGLDVGIRYQMMEHLYFQSDFNYTYARSTEEEIGNNYIPLAPDFTSTGNLTYSNKEGWSGGLSYRYIKDRPANEDRSIYAAGYLLFDAKLNYSNNHYSIGLVIENLFNAEWNEAQFATESRLQNELTAVEELHFTPGTPFFIKGSLQYRF